MENDVKYECPDLTEEGLAKAQKLLNSFKKRMVETIKDVSEECLRDMYCEVLPYIEGDCWSNLRTHAENGIFSELSKENRELNRYIYKLKEEIESQRKYIINVNARNEQLNRTHKELCDYIKSMETSLTNYGKGE